MHASRDAEHFALQAAMHCACEVVSALDKVKPHVSSKRTIISFIEHTSVTSQIPGLRRNAAHHPDLMADQCIIERVRAKPPGAFTDLTTPRTH